MAYVEKTRPTTNFPRGGWKANYRGPDGKERSRTCRTKAEAERFLTTKAAEMMSGTYVGPAAGKVTLADYSAEWLTRMRPTWRVATAAGVANSLEHHILPVFGRRSVSTIRKSDVEALCASCRLRPAPCGPFTSTSARCSAAPSRTD